MVQHAGGLLRGAIIALGTWFALGVTASIVEAGTHRTVALLPPFWLLGVLGLAGLLFCHTPRISQLPWSLVLLTVLPVMAWVPFAPIAALHAWSGPSTLLLFAFVSAASIAAVWPDGHRLVDGGIAPWIASGCAAVWLGAIWLGLGGRAVTGDEPHYLVIAQSVLADADFDLANNYDARDYQSYYPGLLEPRHVSLGRLGQEYSFHAPGTAILMLPAIALAGPSAARLLIVLFVAAGTGFLWTTARRVSGSVGAAWASWGALVTAAPLSVHATMIYPDALGAAATGVGLWALARTESHTIPGRAALVASGAILAWLPWLHIRLGLVAAVFGVATVIGLWRADRRLAPVIWFLIVPAAAALLLFWSTWTMFGTFDPTATFRQKAAGSLSASPTGALGLLFDQEYGLLPYAPAFAFSLFGLPRVWHTRPLLAAASAIAAVGTLVMAASWVWWGGQSGPARFLVAVMPIGALWLAVWWTTVGPALRTLALAGIVMAVTSTTLLVVADSGAYVVNDPDGAGTVFQWMSHSVSLAEALPSMFRPGATPTSEAAVAMIWSGVAITVAVTMRARYRAVASSYVRWAGSAILCVVGLSLGSTIVWWWRDVVPWTPDRAELAVLHAAGRVGLDVAAAGPPPRLTRPHDLVAALAIEAPRLFSPSAALHVPFVPAGRYRIEASPLPGLQSDVQRRLVLELGREAWPMATWLPDKEPGPSFVLPVPIWAVRVTSPQEAPSSWRVRLVPVEVSNRVSSRRVFASRATRYGDLVVFSLDQSSYPETGGLWLAGDRESAVLVADLEGRPSAVRLTFEAGSAPVEVALARGERWHTRFALAAHEHRQVDVPASENGRLDDIRAHLRGAFTAADGRLLGAWLSVSRPD